MGGHTRRMKYAALIISLMASPVLAQEEDSVDLLQRGAQAMLEELLREIEPALKDLQGLGEQAAPALRGFLAEMGPALTDLMDKVEDWSVYEPPEILENGDIIIRRKVIKPGAEEIEI